ncbi:Ku protein [bacterium]|nr:Ku protein [bacterium]
MPKAKRKGSGRSRWRASWRGDLRFGLVRFSVEAINAYSRSTGDIHFHQLHAKCHRRIEYHKACPIHGEVDQDEIVMGYEYGRGKYVEIDPEELDEARTQQERTLNIEEFISEDGLDQIYLDGRMYYLSPAGARDQEPYHLMRRAMLDDGRLGIGQVVFSGKEQLTAVIPREDILIMAMLNYAPEIRDAELVGVGEAAAPVSSQNLRLAKSLIRSMTNDDFDIGAYKNRYHERVQQIINAKRKGKTIVTPETEEEEPVINLMDALKRSLSNDRGTGGSKRIHRPKKRAKAV